MRWGRQPKVERPEFPKLIPISVTTQEAQELLSSLVAYDADAEIVDGGERGVYVRVHNQTAELAAGRHGEARSFPLA